MGIINCKGCGTVCIDNPSEQCSTCQQEMRQSEEKVIEYLEANQNSTMERNP